MTKAELSEMLGAYREQIDFLKAELEEARKRENKLNEQVQRLQDGLMAVRSPEAYRDWRADSSSPTISQEQQEFINKEREIIKIQSQYAKAMEGDIFRSREDIEDLMNSVLLSGEKPGSRSLHGNDES